MRIWRGLIIISDWRVRRCSLSSSLVRAVACALVSPIPGKRFAPKTKIEGVSVQDFLQDCYIKSIAQVAKRLVGMPHVLGYGQLCRGFLFDENRWFQAH